MDAATAPSPGCDKAQTQHSCHQMQSSGQAISRLGAVAFDNICDGILAQSNLAPDQAIAASLCDKCHDFRRQSVGFWPLPRLAAQMEMNRKYVAATRAMHKLVLVQE
jgi:hypothetical protein